MHAIFAVYNKPSKMSKISQLVIFARIDTTNT